MQQNCAELDIQISRCTDLDLPVVEANVVVVVVVVVAVGVQALQNDNRETREQTQMISRSCKATITLFGYLSFDAILWPVP